MSIMMAGPVIFSWVRGILECLFYLAGIMAFVKYLRKSGE